PGYEPEGIIDRVIIGDDAPLPRIAVFRRGDGGQRLTALDDPDLRNIRRHQVLLPQIVVISDPLLEGATRRRSHWHTGRGEHRELDFKLLKYALEKNPLATPL